MEKSGNSPVAKETQVQILSGAFIIKMTYKQEIEELKKEALKAKIEVNYTNFECTYKFRCPDFQTLIKEIKEVVK